MNPAQAAPRGPRSRIWWWIAAAIALHLAAWAAWFTIATRHPVADVPLAGASRH